MAKIIANLNLDNLKDKSEISDIQVTIKQQILIFTECLTQEHNLFTEEPKKNSDKTASGEAEKKDERVKMEF